MATTLRDSTAAADRRNARTVGNIGGTVKRQMRSAVQRQNVTTATVAFAATAVTGTTQQLTWAEMLIFALSQGGAGFIVFKLLEFLYKLTHGRIPASAKFYLAMALSFVVPVGAYMLQILCKLVQPGPAGFVSAILIGYMVSQSIHWE